MDKQIISAIISSILLICGTTALKNLQIHVPPRVRSGDSVTLSCTYDLENTLYAIKWYLSADYTDLADQEFYRYVPQTSPSKNSYSVQGIKILMERSNQHDVTLVNISRELSGLYKCEVSEDVPIFDTAIAEERMEVVDVPVLAPVIKAEKHRILPGGLLIANCTSGASHPPANITFTVNGNRLNDSMDYKMKSGTIPTLKAMASSWSKLRLNVTSNLFKDNRILLRCFAIISGVYTATSELEITEDAPRLASITGDASAHRGKNGCGKMLEGSIGNESLRILILVKLVAYLTR